MRRDPGSLGQGTSELPTILHVCAPALAGGLETVIRHLSRAQLGAGYRVLVAAVLPEDENGRPHPFLDGLRADGIPARTVVAPGKAFLRERTGIAELIRSHRAGVVHTHGDRADVVDGGLARRLGAASVSTVHGFTRSGTWMQRVYERLNLLALRRFDAVVAVSGHLASQLRSAGVPEARLHLVSNAWAGAVGHSREEARRLLRIDPTERLIGWIGRLSHEKAPDVLVRALPQLRNTTASVGFVGEGPLLEATVKLAAGLAIGSRIRWFGRVQDAGSFLAAFDVLALTSRTEGTPMVLLEAMAARVPIVATRVGGVPDVLQEGAGLLVGRDDPGALAGAIDSILENPGLANDLREAGRRRLEQTYSAEAWIDQYDAVYRAAMTRRRARSRRPRAS